MRSDMEDVVLYWPKGLFFWKPKRIYARGGRQSGKREGRWVFWYRSGAKQLEGEYLNGKKHGVWTKWWETGAKWTEGVCVRGKMDGKWTEWHANGEKARESHWVMGKKDGQWTYWRPDGSLERTETYDHRLEEVQQLTVCTDLDARNMVKQIQKAAVNRNWEKMVGKPIADLVKPWHIACWVLIFVVGVGVSQGESKLRGVGLAALLAFSATFLIAWVTKDRHRREKGRPYDG